MTKKILLCLTLIASIILFLPENILADAAPGDTIITLGEDLSPKQKEQILAEMKVTADDNIIYVSNAEEHKYLGDYIPKAQIGTKALSSSMITLGEKDSGLTVSSNNINWVSDQMFINALTTAGVKDATIYVTGPFPVSGTAGLTGLFKAYETSANVKISEETKQIANEEMVQTATLGDTIGETQATDLMSLIKAKIAEEKPKDDEAVRSIIEEAAKQLDITLTPEVLDGLVEFFNRMKDAKIDWSQVQEDVLNAKAKFEDFLAQEETQNFLQKAGETLKALIKAVASWFSSDNSTN